MNLDGTYNESFQKAIANDPLPQPENPLGRPTLPKREANAPRYKKLRQQLHDNALVRKRIPKEDDDALARVVGINAKGADIMAPRGFEPVWGGNTETVLGHMDWRNGIAVRLGHTFPELNGANASLEGRKEKAGQSEVQVAGAIPLPIPLLLPVVSGQPPEESNDFPQGPGTIPMDQAQQIEKWLRGKFPEFDEDQIYGMAETYLRSGVPGLVEKGIDSLFGSETGKGKLGTTDEGITLQSQSSNKSGKQAQDSGKNEPHGDGGRALDKAKQRQEELDKAIQDAKSRKEKKKLKEKKKNLIRDANRKKKGEHHGQKGKGNKK